MATATTTCDRCAGTRTVPHYTGASNTTFRGFRPCEWCDGTGVEPESRREWAARGERMDRWRQARFADWFDFCTTHGIPRVSYWHYVCGWLEPPRGPWDEGGE